MTPAEKQAAWRQVHQALLFDGSPLLKDGPCEEAFNAILADEAWLEKHPYPDRVLDRLAWVNLVTLTIIGKVTGEALVQKREPIPTAGQFEPAGKADRERPPPGSADA